MKFLKIFGLVLLGIVVIYLVLCFVGPKDFNVSRSIVIKAEKASIFDQVAELKNWNNWSPWHKMDPEMDITWGESTRGKGASYSWKGEKAGEGSLETVEFTEGSYIKNKLNFGAMGTSHTEWNFGAATEGVEVTWSMSGKHNFFLRGMMNFMDFDEMLGKDFDEGLQNLKDHLESDGPISTLSESQDPVVVERQKMNCICIHDTTNMEGLANMFSQSFMKLGIFLAGKGKEMAGQPFAMYFGPWSEEMVVLSACFPVSGVMEGKDDIEFVEIPAGEYVFMSHFGSYDDLGKTHEQIESFAGENDISLGGFCIEQYISDPMATSDTADWQTDIMYPVGQLSL